MYTDIELDINKSAKMTDRPWDGVIKNTVTGDGQDVFVVIPNISHDHKWGPCRWSARAGLSGPIYPSNGAEALIHFDDNHRPWIVQWWPYA